MFGIGIGVSGHWRALVNDGAEELPALEHKDLHEVGVLVDRKVTGSVLTKLMVINTVCDVSLELQIILVDCVVDHGQVNHRMDLIVEIAGHVVLATLDELVIRRTKENELVVLNRVLVPPAPPCDAVVVRYRVV